MADLNELQSAGATKIIGSDSLGVETTPAKVSSNQDLGVSDVVDSSGLYGQLTVGTTPVELKVGASPLSARKLLTLDNTGNATLYWGFNSSISTSNFAGRIFKDQQASWAVGPNVSIYVVSGSAGNTVHIAEGA